MRIDRWMSAAARAALALAWLAPATVEAQGRFGPVPAPQIPAAVSHIPHAPQVPQVPQVPQALHLPQRPQVPQIPPAGQLPGGAAAAAAHARPLATAGGALARTPPGQARAALAILTHGPGAALESGDADTGVLAEARLKRNSDKAAAAPLVLALSARGDLVLRGQVLALAPSRRALDLARRHGFAVADAGRLRGLGLDVAVLLAPAGLSTDDALAQLRAGDPDGAYDFNPVYETTGSTVDQSVDGRPGAGRVGRPEVIGLVDTGVATSHPALATSRIVQRGFAPGGAAPGEHGTAIASLITGEAGRYRGAAPRSTVYVADVYGAGAGGGGAAAVAQAIDWLVQSKTPVINISLVGPANRVLEAAIDAAVAKGVVVVAAVGNDGPFSPPLYPAAYRNVVAVTGVDRRNTVLAEAVRSTPVAFAAPGADIAAAKLGGGFAGVRGTSFAAPIVAAEIALDHRRMDRRDAIAALERLRQRATRNPGAQAGAAFGWGLVGEDLRPSLTNPATAAVAAGKEKIATLD